MQEKLFQLSEFEEGDFYSLSNKIVSNQTIHKKDFSEFFIRKVNFSNCIFDLTNFPCTKCQDLIFEGCILQNGCFRKSELQDVVFKNCKLINVEFSRCELIDFDFINCKLNSVYFIAAELTYIKIENSQLQDVWFSGSLIDNVKIKNSTLESIIVESVKVYKETNQNGLLIPNWIPINDYDSFLKEISFPGISSKNLPYQKLISRSFQFLAAILLSEIVVVFFYISTGN